MLGRVCTLLGEGTASEDGTSRTLEVLREAGDWPASPVDALALPELPLWPTRGDQRPLGLEVALVALELQSSPHVLRGCRP